MKKIKNKIILLVMMLGLKIISFSYEDYYEKVYTIKVSKEELYKEINATLKQKKRLEKILETYQKKAEKIEDRLIKFENKKIELGKIESKRYEEISKVLSENQLQSFNIFINSQKLAFEQKNDKIKNLIDNLNLTNEQKSEILRYERNFQRYINNIEISHDKSVSGAKVEAWTVDGDNVSTSDKVSGTFDLSYKADAKFDNGTFTLAKDMDIDFNNIGKLGFTNVEKIDLGAGNGKNELLNLTLQDVLDMGKKDGGNINLTILGDSDDKVTFKNEIGKEWSSNVVNDDKGNKLYTEWSNTTGDTTVTVKVEQPISDGITN